MSNFLLKEISGIDIKKELEFIGFDKSYIDKAADKFQYKNIKIFALSVAQANILKQTALIFGADCAVNRDVITGKAENSDVILCGSLSQLKKIAAKLKSQPFKLAILGDEILKFIERKQRTTKIAGILNITPDSFSDGGMYFEPKNVPEIVNNWNNPNYFNIRFEGGESKKDALDRVLAELVKITSEDFNIAGVAIHGGTMGAMLNYLHYDFDKLANCAAFHLVYENGEWHIEGTVF